jgi:hypothetical protein
MAAATPRAVLVTRPTEYDALLATHATRGQARFFLESRGQKLDSVLDRHHRFSHARHRVLEAVPGHWRRARVSRDDLDRFLFEPDDFVIVLGQDGLVANVAKYLGGQPVVGLNPDPERHDGVLVPHPPEAAGDLLAMVASGRGHLDALAMVEAEVDGRRLLALNEIFIGHASHQSARYQIAWRGQSERQSSSGLIVTTGTGSTGWALSINRQRPSPLDLPAPSEQRLAFFVREAFPSGATGISITQGELEHAERLEITSRMDHGGVLFGDGIEGDHLPLPWGAVAQVCVSKQQLHLLR